MKTLLALIPLIAAVLIGTGCRTVTTTSVDANGVTNTVTTKVPDQVAITLIQNTAQSAAFVGTKLWLDGLPPNLPAHPQDRDAFVLAQRSVHALIAGGTFDSQQLAESLRGLPIAALQGPNGSLIVGEAVMLWTTDGKLLATLDKQQYFTTFVLPFAQAIANGLDQALGPPPPVTQ